MKNFKITYALWFAISLAMSSCSCCSGEYPSLSEKSLRIFKSQSIGDSIKLYSDSCNLIFILKSISEDKSKYCKGGPIGGARSFSRFKIFQYEVSNSCLNGFKKHIDLKITVGDSDFNGKNRFFIDGGDSGSEYFDTISVSNTLYSNVNKIYVNTEDSIGIKMLRSIYFDSLGFVCANNLNKNIYYKK